MNRFQLDIQMFLFLFFYTVLNQNTYVNWWDFKWMELVFNIMKVYSWSDEVWAGELVFREAIDRSVCCSGVYELLKISEATGRLSSNAPWLSKSSSEWRTGTSFSTSASSSEPFEDASVFKDWHPRLVRSSLCCSDPHTGVLSTGWMLSAGLLKCGVCETEYVRLK